MRRGFGHEDIIVKLRIARREHELIRRLVLKHPAQRGSAGLEPVTTAGFVTGSTTALQQKETT
jgi:hypothetical protein